MTVKECYSLMDADYDDILHRFGTEERICKFLAMLLRDSNLAILEDALKTQDYETAFRAAHTLKGVALNLSLTRLTYDASALTEALRPQQENDSILPLFQQLKLTYDKMLTALHGLLD